MQTLRGSIDKGETPSKFDEPVLELEFLSESSLACDFGQLPALWSLVSSVIYWET
jgi:hypothetical protein